MVSTGPVRHVSHVIEDSTNAGCAVLILDSLVSDDRNVLCVLQWLRHRCLTFLFIRPVQDISVRFVIHVQFFVLLAT